MLKALGIWGSRVQGCHLGMCEFKVLGFKVFRFELVRVRGFSAWRFKCINV